MIRSSGIAAVAARCLILVLALSIGVALAAPAARAQADASSTVTALVTDLNNRDLNDAEALIAPDFTLTLPNGTTMTWAELQTLQALLPAGLAPLSGQISILSLTPEDDQTVSAVLQFGNIPPVTVNFTEENGLIGSIAIVGSTTS